MPEPLGWHSRGYLPHFDGGDVAQLVTFRLAGTIPPPLLDRWRADLAHLAPADSIRAMARRIDAHLDMGVGEQLLAEPAVGGIVEERLLWADGEAYRLHAWVVMPNHVHVLCTPLRGHSLSSIVQAWKSVSSRRIGAVVGRQGMLWQADYHDRYIRDERHFGAALAYIERNPVKAGLCTDAVDWPLGSARRSADALVRKTADEPD